MAYFKEIRKEPGLRNTGIYVAYARNQDGTAGLQSNSLLPHHIIHGKQGSNFILYPSFSTFADDHHYAVVMGYCIQNERDYQVYHDKALRLLDHKCAVLKMEDIYLIGKLLAMTSPREAC